MKPIARKILILRIVASAAAAGIALTGCGGGAPSGATSTSTTAGSGSSQVLPSKANPISNTATAKTLKIDSVLVENNVDIATGKDAEDHLEIALTNTGTTVLTGFEVYYSFTDPSDGTTEGYYAKLPSSFTIPAGGSRVVHFDNTGATDHFPENVYSLYHSSTNALRVSVTVSAEGAAVQTTTVKKDAGGAENPGE